MTPEDFNELAWHDAVLWAFDEPDLRAQFQADTGIDLATSGIDRLIDEATGKRDEDLEAFIAWFDRNLWGDEWSPRAMKEKEPCGSPTETPAGP